MADLETESAKTEDFKNAEEQNSPTHTTENAEANTAEDSVDVKAGEQKSETNAESHDAKTNGTAPKQQGQAAASPQTGMAPSNNLGKDGKLLFEADKYAETDKDITWVRDEAIKIRYGKEGSMDAMPSLTVMSMIKSTRDKYPNALALAYKEGDTWQRISYERYYDLAKATAKSFIKLGLEQYRGVGILGFNSKEWFLSNLGAIFAGGLSVGIYTTNSADAVAYVLNSSESNICVVENDAQLKKVLQVWDEVPHLKAVVQYAGKPDSDKDNVYSWDDFMKLGEEVTDEELSARMDDQYVNKCCSLIFTSGTTGKPKGVMLSHDNITYCCRVIGQFVRLRVATETIISYLPLSHIAAQLLDMYLPICYACGVYFARPDALKGTLNDTMKEVLPTVFFGVPRVYEKMEDKLKIGIGAIGGLKKKLLEWARGKARQNAQNMMKGHGPPFAYGLAHKILGSVRTQLGLTNCRYQYCGAAPLTPETHSFFSSIGLPIHEVYGMSESSGATTMTVWVDDNKHWKPGSAGYTIPGYGTELLDKNEKGHGEIAMVGRHVFMGYLGEEEKTKDTFDAEYRLRSGDVGYLDADGFLFISGRIKELLITAGGENVAPVPIENDIKEALPQVSNCMLIGDKRKFLSVLISFKVEVDLETMIPTENFTPQTIDWLKSIGSNATKVSEVTEGKDEAVTKAVDAALKKVNAKSESNAKRIAKFAILPQDFSIPGGELGPTLKLKRPAAVEKHEALIEGLYAD